MFGGAPSIGWRRARRPASRRGTLCSKPSVYGWRGDANNWSAEPVSTKRPAYMTLTRSHMPGDDAEVVRDQDQRRVLLRDERAQEVEDLGLDRHVERGRRLVRDQELRLAGESHRDHRALAHAARELMRVVLGARFRARNADPVERLGRARLRLLAVHVEVRLERLADLPADSQHRVQRRHRVLEDHRDLAPADSPQGTVALPDQVLTVEERAARTRLGRSGRAVRGSQAT